MNNTKQNKENRPIIAVLGCGNMAMAMLGGLVGTDIDEKYHFNCSSRSIQSAQTLATYFQSATAMKDNVKAVQGADKVMLCIKPQQAKDVCTEIKNALSSNCHISSVMAGITIETLSNWCGVTKISRIMPNTPALIGQGMSGIFHHPRVDDESVYFVKRMMDNVGLSLVVDDEDKIHAVTAISGSGPAYFFHFIYLMQNAAIELGFSPQDAEKLVNQTAFGAVNLVIESDDSAHTLQQKVCSPGGTTEQAIKSFENANMQKIIKEAMNASGQRSKELSKLF